MQDPEVNRLLQALSKYELVVFTNADERSAREGLEVLGISQFFTRVFGAEFMGETCKPDHAAFYKVLAAVGTSPAESVFFDDSLRNVKAAKELGITTVYVANRSTPQAEWDTAEVHAAADYVVPFPTFTEVHQVFPHLLDPEIASA